MNDHRARLLALLLVAALSLSGCASGTAETAAEPATSSEPAAERLELVFFDSGAFDKDLSKAFRADARRVEVKAASPFDLNDIPDRLEGWLAAVQDSGGEVKAAEIDAADNETDTDGQTRGIITEVIDLVVMAVGSAREEALYEPAADYDVWLRYHPDGMVEEAIFVRRDESS